MYSLLWQQSHGGKRWRPMVSLNPINPIRSVPHSHAQRLVSWVTSGKPECWQWQQEPWTEVSSGEDGAHTFKRKPEFPVAQGLWAN